MTTLLFFDSGDWLEVDEEPHQVHDEINAADGRWTRLTIEDQQVYVNARLVRFFRSPTRADQATGRRTRGDFA